MSEWYGKFGFPPHGFMDLVAVGFLAQDQLHMGPYTSCVQFFIQT